MARQTADLGGKQLRTFGRDAGINVLANLVAAGIVASAAYLVAVALGYLRANPAAISLAISFLLGVLTSTVSTVWLNSRFPWFVRHLPRPQSVRGRVRFFLSEWSVGPHAARASFDGGVAVFQEVWNRADPPPAITVHVVAGLNPGCLVEIDAVAVV